ncbi:related to Palmitoyltransferase PFA4 [Cephalotrichum gorgonifer]|uniref:Palmitoyltransferase n=1 Tax=Cephalotrichum gorgonifer TaxID=2041049 RepID=A0AAE8MWW1_9PEZI|nr:related to Palmitoyltransferase PFA4 [Cephalotrichum gorgonifer]
MEEITDIPFIQRLAVPSVCLLISFLAYTSQILFHTAENLDPGPPTPKQTVVFNLLLASLWWTYYRACSVSPGRYPEFTPADAKGTPGGPEALDRFPPRHPMMDHHCPWTGNCVSLTTYPHFLRFLLYANLSLWNLSYLLFLRFGAIWSSRNWPAYLGPSLPALIHLTLLGIVCFVTEVALGLMLVATIKGWIFNVTTIEDSEIERHERNVERGGWFDNDSEPQEKVEFPYDVSFFGNMSQAMGTRNFLLWFFPFSGSPSISPDRTGAGWVYEENDINDAPGMWPPPDPSRREWSSTAVDPEFEMPTYASPSEQREAFRRRQEADVQRWGRQRDNILAELEEVDDYEVDSPVEKQGRVRRVYEEDIEVLDDDDDVPLGELVRRRKGVRREEE